MRQISFRHFAAFVELNPSMRQTQFPHFSTLLFLKVHFADSDNVVKISTAQTFAQAAVSEDLQLAATLAQSKTARGYYNEVTVFGSMLSSIVIQARRFLC